MHADLRKGLTDLNMVFIKALRFTLLNYIISIKKLYQFEMTAITDQYAGEVADKSCFEMEYFLFYLKKIKICKLIKIMCSLFCLELKSVPACI